MYGDPNGFDPIETQGNGGADFIEADLGSADSIAVVFSNPYNMKSGVPDDLQRIGNGAVVTQLEKTHANPNPNDSKGSKGFLLGVQDQMGSKLPKADGWQSLITGNNLTFSAGTNNIRVSVMTGAVYVSVMWHAIEYIDYRARFRLHYQGDIHSVMYSIIQVGWFGNHWNWQNLHGRHRYVSLHPTNIKDAGSYPEVAPVF